jgi:hypothetical protein
MSTFRRRQRNGGFQGEYGPNSALWILLAGRSARYRSPGWILAELRDIAVIDLGGAGMDDRDDDTESLLRRNGRSMH